MNVSEKYVRKNLTALKSAVYKPYCAIKPKVPRLVSEVSLSRIPFSLFFFFFFFIISQVLLVWGVQKLSVRAHILKVSVNLGTSEIKVEESRSNDGNAYLISVWSNGRKRYFSVKIPSKMSTVQYNNTFDEDLVKEMLSFGKFQQQKTWGMRRECFIISCGLPYSNDEGLMMVFRTFFF